jgi:hypothetical protein
MAKIEIVGSKEKMERIAIFLLRNNIEFKKINDSENNKLDNHEKVDNLVDGYH